jgi:hypothetical protein
VNSLHGSIVVVVVVGAIVVVVVGAIVVVVVGSIVVVVVGSIVVVVVGAIVVVVVGAIVVVVGAIVVVVVGAAVVVVVVTAPNSTLTTYWQPAALVNVYVPYTVLIFEDKYSESVLLNIHERLMLTPCNSVRL